MAETDKDDPEAEPGEAKGDKGETDDSPRARARARRKAAEAAAKAETDETSGEDGGDEDEAKPAAAKPATAKPPAAKAESEASADEEPAEDDDEGGENDAAAQRVADALGVGEADAADAAAPADEAEGETAPNRAARRREEAKKRRRKPGAAAATAPTEDDEAPRDRNKRAKELLAKRRDQAAGGPRPVALLPSEMVDDALARSANATFKWMRQNATAIQVTLVAAVLGVGGFVLWTTHSTSSAAAASDLLFVAVADERGRIVAEDKRPDEEKEIDPTKNFKTADERSAAALAAYEKVTAEHAGTGPAMLAKLGEAGIMLDKRDWPKALELYSAVASSSLATADPDVKGRATEGQGFANEGKGDLDAAMAMFKQLESIDAKGFKELGEYHQARVFLKKGDKEKAKELFKKVHDQLAQPTTEGKSSQYLSQLAEDQLRQLDPNAVPPKPTFGGPKGNSMTPEEMRKYIEKIQDASKKKGDQH